MTEPTTANPPFAIPPAAVALAGVTVGVGAAAAAVLLLFDQTQQLPEALTAGGTCLLAAIGSLFPLRWRSAQAPEGAAQGFILGMMIRMVVCLAALLLLGYQTPLDLTELAGWTAGWYLLILGLEAGLLLRYLRLRSAVSHSNKEAAAC